MTTKQTAKRTSITGLTKQEMLQSLTGFDEIAIDKAFGFDVWDNARSAVAELRAFIFVYLTRNEKNAAEAKKAVLAMPFSEAKDYFDTDEAVLPGDKPVTAEGKDSTQPS